MQSLRNEAIAQAKKLNQEYVAKFKKADYKAAIEIALKALNILEENQAETTDIAICYYNIGSSYLKLFENLPVVLKNAISGYENILKELIEKTPIKIFENPEILGLALEAKLNNSIIKQIFNKNPAIVKAFKVSSLLFLAIYHQASLEVIKIFHEANPEAALKLDGSNLLSSDTGDDYEDERQSPNVTSLMLALHKNCFEIADFLLQELPILANMKDGENKLPFVYIDWKNIPLKTAESLFKLSSVSFYKQNNIVAYIMNMFIVRKRLDLANLFFRLGFAMGQNFTKPLNNIDTKNCIVIGTSINETPVSRTTPGFEESITNNEELLNAQNANAILNTNEEFNHYIQLIQLILFSENAYNPTLNIAPLIKLQNWLLINKPEQSLVGYCLNFMLDKGKYNADQLDQAKSHLPKDLAEKLEL